jgi:5-methylcytosine-specific restriction endonuclease McrA
MREDRWCRTKEQREKLASMGFSPSALHAGDFWQADHIVEVVNGGGQTGLENYQTLCTRCHKVKTKRLAHERSMQRRLDREAAQQPLLQGCESA